jgi:hypothetical protein
VRCWAIKSGQLSKLVILCTIFGKNVGWVVNRYFVIVLHRAFPRWWSSSNYMIFLGKFLKLMTLVNTQLSCLELKNCTIEKKLAMSKVIGLNSVVFVSTGTGKLAANGHA